MQENNLRYIKVRVHGKVQGVFYRVTTQEQAISLGLKGFVMNMPDGSVYFEAAGNNENIEKLISWSYIGPPHATVLEVDLEEAEHLDLPERFEIRK
jgi:acylphosphatase